MSAARVVHKFGGTSVADAGRYRSVARILLDGRGEVLRYVGTLDETGRASAGLRPFPSGHAFANPQGSDNVVSFRTARYDAQPMIARGPGAGPEVTAAGVFSDLLRLATFPGAPQ